MHKFNRSAILAAVISSALLANTSQAAAVAHSDMRAHLQREGIDIDRLAQQGRKGYAQPGPSGAAAIKRASVKRRNVAKNPRSTQGKKNRHG